MNRWTFAQIACARYTVTRSPPPERLATASIVVTVNADRSYNWALGTFQPAQRVSQ